MNKFVLTYSNPKVFCLTKIDELFALKDYDDNEYDTVVIGSQEWIVQNLRTTHYADGTLIPNITDDALWVADTTGAWCYYDNDDSYDVPYGKLYSKYASNNVHVLAYLKRGTIQEVGWRVPVIADFIVLALYLGGFAVAGAELKEVGLTHWTTPNTGATNSTGFTGLPGGSRSGATGVFSSLLFRNYLLSSDDKAYSLEWNDTTFSAGLADPSSTGSSVRLIRDI
jgi:uncharacterized protein (TIGR02145 family)